MISQYATQGAGWPPYASATMVALRPAVDEISFFSKFSEVAIELNVWVASELYKTCDKGIAFTR